MPILLYNTCAYVYPYIHSTIVLSDVIVQLGDISVKFGMSGQHARLYSRAAPIA